MKLPLLISCLLLLLPALFAQNACESGIQAYGRGEWEAAASNFSACAKTQPSAEAYYNLALAEYRRGRVGEAAWASASSAALGQSTPNDSLLLLLQSKLPVDLKPLPAGTLQRQWSALALGLPDNLAAGLALLGALSAGCLLFLALVRSPFARRTALGWLAGGLIVLAGVAYGLSTTKARARNDRAVGVVLAPTALHAAPSARSERLRELPPGTRFELGEEVSGTWRVALPTGVEGWVPASDLRRVLSKDTPPGSNR